MKLPVDSQDLVRRFNEDEAVWQCFEQKRQLRESISPFIDSILDEIDWWESEQECRQTRCIGRPLISPVIANERL